MGVKDIYAGLWAKGYADHGETTERYVFAMQHLGQPKSVADVGCGRGTLLAMIARAHPQARRVGVDLGCFTHVAVDEFHEADIATPDGRAVLATLEVDVATATDVLEHLPHDMVEPAIEALLRGAKRLVVTAANHSDVVEGEELHLTQEPMSWWAEMLARHGAVRHAEELMTERLFGFVVERP